MMTPVGVSLRLFGPPWQDVGRVLSHDVSDDIELAIVTLRFEAADPSALLAVMAKYVVLTRMQAGCRNVDLCVSQADARQVLVIQKWESAEAARQHFDTDVAVDMARACTGLLLGPPGIDLWDGPSAHDLA